MKTIIIEQGETMGGAERYILDFLHACTPAERTKQLQVSVLGATGSDYISALPTDVPVIPFSLPSFKGNVFAKIKGGLQMIFRSRKLAKILKKNKTKAVLTNTPRASLFLYFSRVLWGGDYRWSAVVHDFHTQKKLYSGIHKVLRRKMLQTCDTIIAVSLITRKKVKEYLPESEKRKVMIIENGIDTKNLPKPSKKPKLTEIIMLARIDERKGQLELLKAMKILKREHFSVFESLKVRILGESFASDKATVAYEKACKDYNAYERLGADFAGNVADPKEAIRAASLVVMLPQEPETFGRVAIEALGVGTMVLSLAQDGPQQILQAYAKHAGLPAEAFLIAKNTPQAITEKILELKEVEKDLSVLTKDGPGFVQANYDLQETQKRMLDLLLG